MSSLSVARFKRPHSQIKWAKSFTHTKELIWGGKIVRNDLHESHKHFSWAPIQGNSEKHALEHFRNIL